MTIYDVTATLDEIDFAPSSTLLEVLQNVKTIITTPKFSVPLDRGFGISGDIVDLPLPVAQAKATAEIIEAIRTYEPRFKVMEVLYTTQTLEASMEGRLYPEVRGAIDI